jgi:hypothetical protein
MPNLPARWPCLALLLATTLHPAIARETPSHCGVNETIVFSCQTGERIVSLCASRDIGEGRGQLTYRFGRAGRVEMLFPPVAMNPQQAFTYQVLPKGDSVRFSNEGVTYVLFSEIRPGTGDVEGVVVARPGRKPNLLTCRNGALGPEGWGPVYKAKLPRDQTDFEIPR